MRQCIDPAQRIGPAIPAGQGQNPPVRYWSIDFRLPEKGCFWDRASADPWSDLVTSASMVAVSAEA